jgi:hypothetical protein
MNSPFAGTGHVMDEGMTEILAKTAGANLRVLDALRAEIDGVPEPFAPDG